MSSSGPLVLPYSGVSPVFGTAPDAPRSAAVLGRVAMGRNGHLGTHSVIRADGHYVTIGDDFWLGEHGTVHIAHEVYPTHIGDRVTAAANSIIHACDVGSNCVIGRDVVILDGSKVGGNMALEDGSIVYPRSILESGRLYAGRPAKVVRELDAVELDAMHQSLRKHNSARAFAAVPTGEPETIGVHFIAATATLRGTVAIGDNVGVWFGCDLDGGTFGICVGDRTNIQDNTIIRSNHHPVGIAEEVTIGHNVTMNDCTILARSLVGMGAVVSPGTIISEDVFLAAGAVTEPGQTLESGWLYGGNPARQLRRLDDEKRKIITSTWRVYMDYARDFDHEQRLIG